MPLQQHRTPIESRDTTEQKLRKARSVYEWLSSGHGVSAGFRKVVAMPRFSDESK